MSNDIIGGFKFTGRFLLSPDAYARRTRTDFFVVHCSATKATWDGGAEEIRKWHTKDRGWMDIGYHFVIKRDGTVERGRPQWAVGAGVAGFNASSLHICLVGGIDNDGNPEDNFTSVQKGALAFLLGALTKHVSPKAEVLGHRDFPNVKKACPSFDVSDWWTGSQPKASTVRGFAFEQTVKGESFLN